MSAKPGSELDPLDLLLRARSSTLVTEEEHALERALATSAALRIAHQVGHDLDFACRVRARDQALVDRALDRALAPSAKPRARRATSLAGILAATLVVASAAAATHAVVVERLAPAVPGGTSAPSLPAAPKAAGRVPAHAAPRVETEAAVETSPALAGSVLSERSPALRSNPAERAATAPVASPEPTAGGLFREAGAARRAGDFAKARALYLELQSRFPASNEATVSHVSLGNLLLSAARPSAAKEAFDRYLHSGQRGLREEALAGLADALLAMGRTEEERRAREDLLRLDPGGVYASRARRRIAEIAEARRGSSH